MKRVSNDLLDIADETDADFIFISEPHLFQCDLDRATAPLNSCYSSSLNSDDLYNQELPLLTSRAFGGTLSLWKRCLDPFVKILNVNTASFLPLLLNVPGYLPSAHFNIYLPTAGLNSEYVSALSCLENAIEEILDEYGDIPIYIRGDANAAIPPRPNNTREKLLQYFCDSSIDVFLQRKVEKSISEKINNIFCSKNDPRIDSKHDAIFSAFNIPFLSKTPQEKFHGIPEVQNLKHKILWSEDDIPAYQNILSTRLLQLQDDWSNPSSPVSFSLLLQLTNEALSAAAKLTHKFRDLSKEFKPQKYKTPPELSKASSDKKNCPY